jgi:Rrf2 family nitric oxide-sensitive transcriptional repressor
MKLTSFTDYSLRALMYLSIHSKRLCTIKEISDVYGISHNHLVKVIYNLTLLKYVQSVQGKGGGIRLSVPAEKISLRKLIEELEPNFHLVECFDKNHNTCPIVSMCGFRNILNKSLEAFLKTLEAYTLADAIVNRPVFENKLIELSKSFFQSKHEK